MVSDEAVILVGYKTEITAEAEVLMVTTPIPPTRTDIECGAAVRTVGMEVGRSIENSLIGGIGKMAFVRPCHQVLTVRPCH